MRTFAIVATLCVAAALAGGAIDILMYDGSTCSGKPSQNVTVPTDTCSYGSKFSCQYAASRMCVGVKEYNGTKCDKSLLVDAASAICGFCQVSNTMGSYIIDGCSSTGATVKYECDSDCKTCAKSVTAGTDSCFLNPIAPDTSIDLVGVSNCGEMVVSTTWKNSNTCQGQGITAAFPADSCTSYTSNGKMASIKYACKTD